MKNTSQHNKNTILNYGKYYLNKKKNTTTIDEKSTTQKCEKYYLNMNKILL